MSIIERVKKLNFPEGEFVVVGSGTLDALGIRLACDIDIAVLPVLHAQLRKTGEWKEEERYGKIFLMQDGVDVIPELSWENYPTTAEEAIASATILGGVCFMNLEELRKFKLALGREKDAEDIALIDAYEKSSRSIRVVFSSRAHVMQNSLYCNHAKYLSRATRTNPR